MVSRRQLIFTLSGVLYLSQVSCGQLLVSQVRQEDAITKIRVASIPGWQEVISDEGRFRILFPREPEVEDDVKSMKGFKLVEKERNFFVYYTDYETPRPSDEVGLRTAYRGSVGTLIGNSKARGQTASLLSQKDVFLHDRLGTEFVIERPDAVSYMRAFAFGHRLYTLAVDVMRAPTGDATIPNDVGQFFDSFIYWDVH